MFAAARNDPGAIRPFMRHRPAATLGREPNSRARLKRKKTEKPQRSRIDANESGAPSTQNFPLICDNCGFLFVPSKGLTA